VLLAAVRLRDDDDVRPGLAKAVQRVAEVRSMPSWRIVQLERAEHYVWITNRDDAPREMKAFLGM
jgi:hypothetical protein